MSTVEDAIPRAIPINEDGKNHKKDVQSLFKPFNMMYALFFCSKYGTRNDVISTNSLLYKIVSGFCCLVIFISYCISIFINISTIKLEGINYSKLCSSVAMCVLFFPGYVMIYYTNVIDSHKNVLLEYKIQNIYEIIKSNSHFIKNFVRYSWFGIAAVNFYQLHWVLFFTIAFSSNYEYYEVATNYVFVIFDVIALYCARVLRLIREPLHMWLDEVRNAEHVEDKDKAHFWNVMFRIYMETLDAYLVASKTAQPGVFLYTVGTFSFAINSIAERIEIGKVTAMSMDIFVPLAAISLFWLIKNMIMLIYLVMQCEKFYSAMTEVRNTCLRVTVSTPSSDIQKIVCKKILRIHTTVFKKITAYQLYEIDAKILLSLCSLITAYTVVTLQFEFM